MLEKPVTCEVRIGAEDFWIEVIKITSEGGISKQPASVCQYIEVNVRAVRANAIIQPVNLSVIEIRNVEFFLVVLEDDIG